MSDFRYRELGRFIKNRSGDMLQLGIPLPKSEAGMNTFRCPEESCEPRVFQLGDAGDGSTTSPGKGWRRPAGQPAVTCPYCGRDDDQQNFIHPDDIEAAKAQIA